MPNAILLLILSCLAALVLTRAARTLAPRLGLTDRPDGQRKLHRAPTALGGGVAVFLAMLLVLGAGWLFHAPWRAALASGQAHVLGLLAASTLLVVVGLADDARLLRGRQKLLGQLAAALVLIATGLCIKSFEVFGWRVDLGLLSVPFTIFWLLGAINSVNLLDGIDGLASTVGIILAGTIAFMAALTGDTAVALIALSLAGGLIGFLRYNFPPATIFLGDAGSMLIGLVVGSLAIEASLKGPGTVLLAAPLAVCAIPIFDSAAAVIRRKLTGRSLYSTDRAHLHHRLLERLGSNGRVLAVVAVCCSATCAAALLSLYWQNDLVALVTCLGVLTILIVTRVFGHTELALAGQRLANLGRSLSLAPAGRDRVVKGAVRLQGTRHWDVLWDELTRSADRLDLTEIRLDVNLPLMHEGYHASWRQPPADEPGRSWRLAMPLVVADAVVGNLVMAGRRNGASAGDELEKVMDLLHPFEANLIAMASDPDIDVIPAPPLFQVAAADYGVSQ